MSSSERLKKWIYQHVVKIESKLSKWRRSFKIDKEMEYLLGEPLRRADTFLKRLYENDDFYHQARYAWVAAEDAKKLYLYGCARQVIKAGFSLMEDAEFLLEEPQEKTTLSRSVIESIVDRQNLVIRRHIELLINLLNFIKDNRLESYRIFLNLENLDHFLGRQSDFSLFYEAKSGNIQHSVNDFVERIKEDLKSISGPQLWFLKGDWEKRINELRPGLLQTIRQRFKNALPLASDDERVMIGRSYNEVFAQLSVSAHAAAGSRVNVRHQQFKSIRGNISVISFLGQHIISRANELMGFDDPGDFVKKAREDNKTIASQMAKKDQKIFEKGDIVLAAGELAEIIESRLSKFNYAVCRVKFLSKPPLPDVPEDWLPSYFVIPILPKSQVRSFIYDHGSYNSLPVEIKEILERMREEPDDNIISYAKKPLIILFEKGILISELIKSGHLKEIPREE